MSRYYSYLNTAENILQQYRGAEPFAAFIKKFFAGEKKYGSGDRKMISHLCYCYFRTAALFQEYPLQEKMVRGLFLCTNQPSPIISLIHPEWVEMIPKTAAEKLEFLSVKKSLSSIFPFISECSPDIDAGSFAASHLSQPDLFIRIRPGFEKLVREKLEKAGITYRHINESAIAVANGAKLEDCLQPDREAVIQDLSSQRVGDLMRTIKLSPDRPLRIWDCCAASGGKSIMAVDMLNSPLLTVSDIRESILANLAKRFRAAGIAKYHSFLADLTKEENLPDEEFDLVIADVPCSGSGTWGRTPEQLLYFTPAEIPGYVGRQQKIVVNAANKLANGGYLLYITCSVFKKENEEMAAFIQRETGMELITSQFFRGYTEKADSMYAAMFRRNL